MLAEIPYPSSAVQGTQVQTLARDTDIIPGVIDVGDLSIVVVAVEQSERRRVSSESQRQDVWSRCPRTLSSTPSRTSFLPPSLLPSLKIGFTNKLTRHS